jgi:glycerophosphoryl diester phosphodiesterase
VLLLGHRGARPYAPENTLAAFELALQHGCDGFEFDVRASADGRAVICHDARLRGRMVERCTYADLCARSPGLTTLDDVLTQFASRAFLYIEVKVGGIEEAVLAALRAYAPERGHVVASFLPQVLHAFHALNPKLPLGYISNDRRKLALWRELPVSVVMPHFRLATPPLVQELHAAGKQVYVWTVNSEKAMQRAAASGVDAIVSDDTKRLCNTLQRGRD